MPDTKSADSTDADRRAGHEYPFTEFQRRVLLALIDAEAARVSGTAREGRAMKHRLFALFRERYGCKYTLLPRKRYREAAIMLLDEPLR